MDLTTYTEPERTRKVGEQVLTLTPPSAVKIQTTGPGASTVIEAGPGSGKTWTVLVRVEIKET